MATSDIQLQQRLHHTFDDNKLLQLALTHRSCGSRNNERLEFLGDSVLGVTISELLYKKFPMAREGDLSRLRSQMVRAESLAIVARALDIGPHLKLGQGELKSGGHRRDSILGDAVEALIGAVYLDAGLTAAQRCIEHCFMQQIEALALEQPSKDAKTSLQEWLQQRGKPLPDYQLLEEGGEAHCRIFTVSCSTQASPQVYTASASSRRKAEQLAAQQMLDQLEQTI